MSKIHVKIKYQDYQPGGTSAKTSTESRSDLGPIQVGGAHIGNNKKQEMLFRGIIPVNALAVRLACGHIGG
jgi:hypothetical protein